MPDKNVEKILKLIAGGLYLKNLHGLEFAIVVLIDAGVHAEVARVALQNEKNL